MNVSSPSRSATMDVDEFMAFLETRPDKERWDLIEGIAVMMAPPNHAHQRISFNLAELLNTAFVARRLDLFAYIGTGVRSPGMRNFQPQPDVAVVPGVSGYELYSERFQLAAEILSPTNRRREVDLKLRGYREAADNLYVVVIEPRKFRVEIYAKRNNWEPEILRDAGSSIEMPEFGMTCLVADLYRGTPLDPRVAKS